MWDSIHVRAVLSQAYLWLMSTVKCFSNYLNVVLTPNSNSRETTLPIAVPNSGMNNSSSSPILVVESPKLLFQTQEIAKTALGLVVPITELLLNDYKGLTLYWSRFIMIALSLGFAVTLNGMLLKGMFRKTASVMEKLGVALIFLGFYGQFSSSLPPALGWICWLCFALSCVPLVWSILPINFNSTSTEDITHINSDSLRRPPV